MYASENEGVAHVQFVAAGLPFNFLNLALKILDAGDLVLDFLCRRLGDETVYFLLCGSLVLEVVFLIVAYLIFSFLKGEVCENAVFLSRRNDGERIFSACPQKIYELCDLVYASLKELT